MVQVKNAHNSKMQVQNTEGAAASACPRVRLVPAHLHVLQAPMLACMPLTAMGWQRHLTLCNQAHQKGITICCAPQVCNLVCHTSCLLLPSVRSSNSKSTVQIETLLSINNVSNAVHQILDRSNSNAEDKGSFWHCGLCTQQPSLAVSSTQNHRYVPKFELQAHQYHHVTMRAQSSDSVRSNSILTCKQIKAGCTLSVT